MFKRYWWMFLVMLPAGAFAGLVVAAVFTYLMPKIYESEAVIEVRPSPPIGNVAERGDVRPQETASRFLDTVRETITSRSMLEKVVEELDLARRWAMDRESAVQVLKSAVIAENIRGKDLISIRVRQPNSEDARDIAAGVANGYKAYRAEIQGREAERYLQELNRAVSDQVDKVEELRKVITAMSKAPWMKELGSDEALKWQNSDNGYTERFSRKELIEGYGELKERVRSETELLQSLKLKQTEASIEAKAPRETVLVHENPVIARTPVSPDVRLNLVLGTAAGFLLSPLMAVLLIWVMNRLMPTGLVEV